MQVDNDPYGSPYGPSLPTPGHIPPLWPVSDDAFALVSSLCDASLQKHKDDGIYYTLGDGYFFYRSGTRFRDIERKVKNTGPPIRFYETYFIKESEPPACLGTFYSGIAFYDGRFTTPDGYVQAIETNGGYRLEVVAQE